VVLLGSFEGGPPDVVDHGFLPSGVGFAHVVVSLGSAFIDMAVSALSYYLLAFLVPVLLTVMLAMRQRRERLEAVET
jgi:hypothetical protein